jgi:hypothetical protein
MTGRGVRGRQQARLLLGAILALDAFLVAVLFVAMPNTMHPMFEAPPLMLGLPLGSLIVAIGIALHLGGLAWMVRILRADPEGHASWWRSVRSR